MGRDFGKILTSLFLFDILNTCVIPGWSRDYINGTSMKSSSKNIKTVHLEYRDQNQGKLMLQFGKHIM